MKYLIRRIPEGVKGREDNNDHELSEDRRTDDVSVFTHMTWIPNLRRSLEESFVIVRDCIVGTDLQSLCRLNTEKIHFQLESFNENSASNRRGNQWIGLVFRIQFTVTKRLITHCYQMHFEYCKLVTSNMSVIVSICWRWHWIIDSTSDTMLWMKKLPTWTPRLY